MRNSSGRQVQRKEKFCTHLPAVEICHHKPLDERQLELGLLIAKCNPEVKSQIENSNANERDSIWVKITKFVEIGPV